MLLVTGARLYGPLSSPVAQKNQEIGISVALGAARVLSNSALDELTRCCRSSQGFAGSVLRYSTSVRSSSSDNLLA